MHSSKLLTDFSFKNVQLNVILCSDSSIWKNWRVGGQINWFLSMNRLQMSVQVIESLGGCQAGLPLMNIEYSSVLNVGLSCWYTLWIVSLLRKFFKVLLRWSYLRNSSSLRSFCDATLIQLNALLLSWITLLYISQRYVPMLKRLLITSASKIFALPPASSLNFPFLFTRL